MRKILTIVCCILVGYLTYGQNNSKEYNELIKKAEFFFNSDDYKNAAFTYSAAFKVGDNALFKDRYNAA